MSIRYLKKHAVLEGHISVEDAEDLSQWLRRQKKPAVHLGQCEQVHAAVLQVLLALAPAVLAPSPNPWLSQALARSDAAA